MTTKQKIRSYVVISEDDPDWITRATSLLKSEVRKLSRSKWLYNKIVQIGYNGDDFIRNRITILFTAFFYKKPSFIDRNYTRTPNRTYARL